MTRMLSGIIESFTPKISDEINGTVKEKLEELPVFLDNIFSNSMKLLDRNIPLEYLGWERMSPKEEIEHMKSGKYVYDMADSNVYIVKFIFRINKTDILEKPLYLIYADQGNITKMSGTRYVCSYIISDRSLSPSISGLFLKLQISKLNFTLVYKTILKNNEKINVDIKHSKILLLNIVDKLGKPITPSFLYLLCKYGISHFDPNMKLFLDSKNKGMKESLEEEYDIYTTVYGVLGSKPRGHLNSHYVPHDLVIAVKKGTGNIDLISTLIYCLDMLPDLAGEVVKYYGDIENEKEIAISLLARLLYKESYSMYRMREDTKQHLVTLEGYLDILTKNNLKYVGIEVEDFYQLIYELITRYQDLVVNFKDYHNNLNNKYMDILSYVSYDIYYTFNKIMLRINRRGKNITSKEISKTFSELSPKKIYSLVKTNGQNLALSVLDNTSDLIYPKATSIQEDQSRGDGVKRGRNNQFPANIKTLSAQQPLLGCVLYLLKSAPSGVLRRNPFLKTFADGNIIQPKHLDKTIRELHNVLSLAPTTNSDDNISELIENIEDIREN